MACRVEAFFVIINRVEFMDGSLIGGGAYDDFVSIPHKTRKANFYECISDIESYDCFCNLNDSCYKY